MKLKFLVRYTKKFKNDLGIDVIYINVIVFLVSINKQGRYISIIHITTQNEEEFFKCLENVLKILCKYNSAGFMGEESSVSLAYL